MTTLIKRWKNGPLPQRVIIALVVSLLLWGLLTLGLRSGLGSINLGADFYIYWNAGRAVVIEGKNPYSPEVVADIQRGILGREALPDEDQLAFAYPPYALLPALPFLFLPFDWAQSGWMAFFILLVFFVLYMATRKSPSWMLPAAIFFYPLFFGLLLGNFVVLVAAIFLAFYSLVLRKETPGNNTQLVLGFALAWATCKPQFSWLLLAFALLLSLRLRLFRVLVGFAIGAAALLMLAFAIYPDWISAWVERVILYPSYTQNIPTLTLILNTIFPTAISAALTGAAAFVCLVFLVRLGRAWWQSRLQTIYLLAFLGVVTFLFHLHSIAYDQLVLYIPFILWAGHFAPDRRTASLCWLFFFLLSWTAFFIGLNIHAIDTIPVLFFAGWWIWIYRKRNQGRKSDAETIAR